jgi:hypothetical protein
MTITYSLYEILYEASGLKNESEKIDKLKKHDTPAIRKLLKFIYDEKVKILLPNSIPPWKRNNIHNIQSELIRSIRKLNMFTEGTGYDTLKPVKREHLFIQFLESIDDNDASYVVLALTDRKIDGLEKETIEKAYDGIFD